MEAIKKQASKLREQVARQQQAILRQLGQLGHGGLMIDEADVELHQQLQNLFKSTRAAKHFQRDIVRGLEGFVSTSRKQIEIVKRLAEDCCKYGIENQDSASPLAKVASDFGTSHASMEDHRERMLGILGYQISEPLRAQINGAPLEDARHLTHRYDRMRQEFETQAAEVIRRQSKSRDTSAESASKLKAAEKRLTELKSSMLTIGREATAAMSSVEDQQQETTFQKLLTMVNAERSYHQNVIAILEKLHSEMILDEETVDPSIQSEVPPRNDNHPFPNEETVSNRSDGQTEESKSDSYFIGKVIHSFEAQSDGELSLELDDYVVVRQIMSSLSLFGSLLFVQVIILGCYGTNDVPFTFVKDAVAKRAVCTDGTPAGYYHAIGFGGGVNNWIIYIMGGGWCNDNSTCQQRRDGPYGSTRSVKPKHFSGILSSNQDINPDFYNWNIVFVYYCDGSSLLGDTDIVDSGANLQSRGSRVLDAIVDDLLEKGMKNANNILFSGRSAGGVATILHCDSFRARVPNVDKIKCFSDAGFLIRARNVAGADYREQYFNSIINFHNLNNFLPKSCTSRIDSGLCMFPENLVQDIQTPLFLLNSAFDWVQINYFLKPDNSGDQKGWQNCTNNLTMCTPAQRELIKKFRNAFLETLMNVGDNPSRGLFINACYSHVFSESDELWNSNISPTLGNMTIAQAVGDWFFDRSSVKLIDNQTDFPVNCPV